ncbi:DUF692 family protein [Sphingomonas sp. PB2P19]|uniref:multinuclear nonheme iron-dependent oxidase n=1 Tax=Sphingomonas rhamnosi TaxID=3096156 RepID=UPI002FC6EB67
MFSDARRDEGYRDASAQPRGWTPVQSRAGGVVSVRGATSRCAGNPVRRGHGAARRAEPDVAPRRRRGARRRNAIPDRRPFELWRRFRVRAAGRDRRGSPPRAVGEGLCRALGDQPLLLQRRVVVGRVEQPAAVFRRRDDPRGDACRALQELYGVPLGHENAAYYRRCPGSDMPEETFLAGLVELSGTYLHLDLHNLYANELNHAATGYSVARFLDTVPIDRVITVHMAGGRWIDGQYHDLHDTPVPDPVWDLLDEVLARGHPGAVILEYETSALQLDTETLDTTRTTELILADLDRARGAWDRAYGGASRRTTRREAA